MLSIHSKALMYAAAAGHIAVSAMVFIAVDPDATPTFAVMLCPYAWLFTVLATASFGLDIVKGEEH